MSISVTFVLRTWHTTINLALVSLCLTGFYNYICNEVQHKQDVLYHTQRHY